MRRLVLLCAVSGLSSCFVADDFRDCDDDEQCGSNRLCVDHVCTFVEGRNPDDGVGADGGALETIVLDGQRLGTQNFPDARVILEGVTVPPGQILAVHATIIEVRGPVNADGAGKPGGGGGGAGAGGHSALRSAFGEGGRGAEQGDNGRGTTTTVGGSGGEGGRGGGSSGGGGGSAGTGE